MASRTLYQWYRNYKQPDCDREVLLFCDEFTNVLDAEIGKTAVKLMNALGYRVHIPGALRSGRAFLSKGFLKEALSCAEHTMSVLNQDPWRELPVIGLEPSAVLTLRDEYLQLCPEEHKAQAMALSKRAFLIEEFIVDEWARGHVSKQLFSTRSKTIALHVHCHQKALSSSRISEQLLSLPPNYSVKLVQSGCCGMAGAFGYEREHYALSMAIGEASLFRPLQDIGDYDVIAANGTSCRHQILDGMNERARHPVELLYEAINETNDIDND